MNACSVRIRDGVETRDVDRPTKASLVKFMQRNGGFEYERIAVIRV